MRSDELLKIKQAFDSKIMELSKEFNIEIEYTDISNDLVTEASLPSLNRPYSEKLVSTGKLIYTIRLKK